MSMSEVQRNTDNYDDISDYVRRFCAEKLYELEKALRPWIDGSFGDISPPHVTGYVSVIKELGRLYGVTRPPRPTDDMLPREAVEQMLEAVRMESDARIQAAVAETELRVRLELQASTAKSIESAKQTALTKLEQLQTRG